MNPAPPQDHGFLLLPRFSMLALGACLDTLAAANDVLGRRHYRPLLLALDAAAVPAGCGTAVKAVHTLAGAPALAALHVLADAPLPEPGRDGHAECLHPLLRQRVAAPGGLLLSGIGTGSAVLAQAGLLDGHRATAHYHHVAGLQQRHPQVVFSSRIYEIDRGRLSCAGGTAALDMLIAWLGGVHGERLAQQLVAHFGLERLREHDERQRAPLAARIGPASAKLHEAVALMEANLSEPLPTEDIARLVGVSRRQLERLFKQHVEALPSRYYAELRLARARRLLQQTSQSILQVALGSGFASGSHFSNAYRARFGKTPRDERSQRAAAFRNDGNDGGNGGATQETTTT